MHAPALPAAGPPYNVTMTVRATPLYGSQMFTEDVDSLLIFYEGDQTSRQDDGWHLGSLTAVAPLNCSDGTPGWKLSSRLAAFAGVQVNLPIFSGEKNHPRVAGAEAELGAMRDDARAIENRVVSEVADAHAELTAERRQVELHHQLIPIARQALASAMGAYVAGRSAFVMVLDAERDLQMHELDLATHLAMYEQRLADLQRAVGSNLGLVQAAESGTRESH